MKRSRFADYDIGLENFVRGIIYQMRDEGLNLDFDTFLREYKLNGGIFDLNAIRTFDQRIFRGQHHISPPEIVSFIAKFVSQIKPKTVLDPACGTCSYFVGIDSLLDEKAQYCGIDVDQSILNMAKEYLILSEVDFKLKKADFLKMNENINPKFDLVVSQPPYGNLYPRIETNDFRFNRLETAFLWNSLNLLNDDGYLFFIMPESWIDSHANLRFRQYLSSNYPIESIISLPESPRSPKNSLFILKKSLPRGRVFFAEYKKENEDILLENFFNEKANENLSEGCWIDSTQLSNNVSWNINFFKSIDAQITLKNNTKYAPKNLSELTDRVRGLNDDENVILLPQITSKDVILKPEVEDEDEFSHNRYIQLKITDQDILPHYLKIYLNSQNGKKQRSLFSRGQGMIHLDPRGLEHMIVEVPDLSVQKEIINAEQKLSEIYNEFETLYHSFNDKIFNYPEIVKAVDNFGGEEKDFMYEDLIWPLATSYRLAVRGSSNITEKSVNYFNLFEMVSAFNSIVLLSALPDDVYSEKLEYIWDLGNSDFSRVSMGDWVGLYSRLSKTYRSLEKDYFDFMPFENSFYKRISSKRLITSMNKIPQMRANRTAHAGNVDEIDAEDTVNELNPYLKYVFDVLKTYQHLDLIYPTHFKKKADLYEIMIKKLEGAYSSFASDKIFSNIDLETDMLYLYDSVSDDRLLLNPNLIKLVKCRVCGNWSVYIYDKFVNKKAIYKSYQVELHPYEEEAESLEDLLELV